jgi:prepilin-type N-terminal cleavage/methylation domain-containing protein
MGFNLIEIMIAVVVLGIIFGFGGFYFVSLLREHRISVQHGFLQREARYALDFIINGQMEEDVNERYRYGGIIASHDANIVKTNDNINEIILYGNPNLATPMIGRIYTEPPNDPDSLWIEYRDGDKHMIIPTEAPELGIDNSYKIYITYNRDPEIDSLYDIELRLKQNVYSRELNVEMHSMVKLRNY